MLNMNKSYQRLIGGLAAAATATRLGCRRRSSDTTVPELVPRHRLRLRRITQLRYGSLIEHFRAGDRHHQLWRYFDLEDALDGPQRHPPIRQRLGEAGQDLLGLRASFSLPSVLAT